jgi:dTDP-4-amino-4,6-dideoxygalactose transaminase
VSTGRIPFLDLAATTAAVREDLDQVWAQVLTHARYIGGPEVEAFESEFARYCESRAAVGVANGTDALELVLAGLGVGPGDEVVVPTNTFVATAAAVCTVGARPRFVDVLPGTLQIDPDAARAAVGPRTAAIVAVHLFGQTADVPRLRAVTERHGLALIEDAAQAHGARFAGARAGSLGDAAAFSFYPGKNLGAFGDGGAVVTADAALADRVRRLANHGRAERDRHLHEVRGRNSRLDTLQAAVLGVRLGRLDADNARRRELVALYRLHLPDGVEPVAEHPSAEAVHHLAVVRVPDPAAATAALDGAGIGWGIHYPIPCHRQPAFAEFADGRLPVAEEAAPHILSLPMSPTLTPADVEEVCAVLERSLAAGPARAGTEGRRW